MTRDPRFRELDHAIALADVSKPVRPLPFPVAREPRPRAVRGRGLRPVGGPRIHVNGKLDPAARRRLYLIEAERWDDLEREGLLHERTNGAQ